MDALEVLALLEMFEEVVDALEVDKKVKREFSREIKSLLEKNFFLRFFSFFGDSSLFLWIFLSFQFFSQNDDK